MKRKSENKNKTAAVKFFCFLLLFFFLPVFSFSASDMGISGKMEVSFSPQYFGANEKVSAEIKSYSFNVDAANIAWMLNGKTISRGIGKKNVSFVTGGPGSSFSLTVEATPPTGNYAQQTIQRRIVEADLLWQAETYTPFFYKGKAEAVIGSKIKVTAVPQGFSAGDENLIYKWQRNYQNQPSASGIGRNYFIFEFSEIESVEKISVDITNRQNTESFQKKVSIIPRETEILFYEESSLEGPLCQKSLLKNFSPQQKEVKVRAEPYFFSTGYLNNLDIKWLVDGQQASPFAKPNLIGFIAPSDAHGTSLISLEIQSARKVFQKAMGQISLIF